MNDRHSYLAIIPARQGSKRLPDKNKLALNGKPLVAWSIEAGLGSLNVNQLVLTSDDQEILSIARHYGIDTITRPSSLATDTATTSEVIHNVLGEYDEHTHIVLLQPTSPLRTANDIDNAIDLLVLKNADAVVGVCEVEHSPLWSNTLDDNLSMENFLGASVKNKRSQDLEKHYRINGSIYICDKQRFRNEDSLFIQSNIFAFLMERESSIDIDTELDFQLADLIMKTRYSSTTPKSTQ